MSEWKVQMFPEEEAFINEVLTRKINNEDGRGDFIAPVRGGIIYLDEYSDYTEEQTKWLIFCRLQDARYKQSGVKGIRFMNFTYNNEVPPIMADPETEDRWGVKRTTTDGQPVNDVTGQPLRFIQQDKSTRVKFKWDKESKGYVKELEETLHESITHDGFPLPEKVLD